MSQHTDESKLCAITATKLLVLSSLRSIRLNSLSNRSSKPVRARQQINNNKAVSKVNSTFLEKQNKIRRSISLMCCCPYNKFVNNNIKWYFDVPGYLLINPVDDAKYCHERDASIS